MQAQTVSALFLLIYFHFTNYHILIVFIYYFCENHLCHFIGPEGVARGEDALTVLENPKSRSQFIDELMEVKMMQNI